MRKIETILMKVSAADADQIVLLNAEYLDEKGKKQTDTFAAPSMISEKDAARSLHRSPQYISFYFTCLRPSPNAPQREINVASTSRVCHLGEYLTLEEVKAWLDADYPAQSSEQRDIYRPINEVAALGVRNFSYIRNRRSILGMFPGDVLIDADGQITVQISSQNLPIFLKPMRPSEVGVSSIGNVTFIDEFRRRQSRAAHTGPRG